MSLAASEFLFFDNVKEASNNVNTFLNLRFITKQKPVLYEKILHVNGLQV